MENKDRLKVGKATVENKIESILATELEIIPKLQNLAMEYMNDRESIDDAYLAQAKRSMHGTIDKLFDYLMKTKEK